MPHPWSVTPRPPMDSQERKRYTTMKARALVPGLVAILLTLAPAGFSQEEVGRSAAVRQMNADVLQLHESILAERGLPRDFDRRAAANLLRQRGQALVELMRQDPGEALKVALSGEVSGTLRRTFPEAAPWVEQSGEWTGEYEAVVMDDFETQTSQTEVRLKSGAEETMLHFAGDVEQPPQCTQEVTVEGMRLVGEMAVRAVTGTSSALACTTTGPQQTLVILAKFPGYADKFTADYARNVFLGNSGARSLNTYWQEVSGGKTSATGTVVGWLTLDKVYSCTDYVNMRLAALKAADGLVDLTQFTRILILFPNPGSCSFGGISTVGCTSISSSRGTSYASLSQLVADYTTTVDRAVQLSSHEAGHGLGLRHAASRDFGAEPLGALGVTGTISTYGDKFDTMGYWNLGHYSGYQKQALGWWGAGTQIQTVQSNGTYTIAPAELGSAGVQALKVQRGTSNNAWLWLEFRQKTGLFDTALPSQVFSGVLVHYDDGTAGGMTHLLDYSSGSANWNGPALVAGSTWTDPYTNLSINVLSVSSSAATVNVSYGTATCSPLTPTLTVAPSSASVTAGQGATYSVTLKNNDSASCTANSFSLQTVLPAGWTGSVTPASTSLAPGQTVTGSLSVTTPSTASTGTYTVGAKAADTTRTQTATAGISVSQPVAKVTSPLSLGLTVNNMAPTTRTKLTFTISATRSGTAQSGVPVTLTIRYPTGSQSTYKLTTGSTGTTALSTFLRTKGTYSIAASASDSGTTVQSSALSLTVR